jgi:hypothetical protein
MSATKFEIRSWLMQHAGDPIFTHMLVVTDTWDYSNYPVYVTVEQNLLEQIGARSDASTRVEEVYNYSIDLEQQLSAPRVWNT